MRVGVGEVALPVSAGFMARPFRFSRGGIGGGIDGGGGGSGCGRFRPECPFILCQFVDFPTHRLH